MVNEPFHPENFWPVLHKEAETLAAREPLLAASLRGTVLEARDFTEALTRLLSEKLSGAAVNAPQLRDLFTAAHAAQPSLADFALHDLAAILQRDPAAASNPLIPFLFFKGFHALQTYRLAHWLWQQDRKPLALFLQSRASALFGVDIHPAARIGTGLLLDHATGIVIGETAVVEDNVSMLHGVTLGGTGKRAGDRHPKIRSGVLLGAGASVLGNIEIGAGAKVAAGSVVLQNVPARMTVAGVPAKIVGHAGPAVPAEAMDQTLDYGSSI